MFQHGFFAIYCLPASLSQQRASLGGLEVIDRINGSLALFMNTQRNYLVNHCRYPTRDRQPVFLQLALYLSPPESHDYQPENRCQYSRYRQRTRCSSNRHNPQPTCISAMDSCLLLKSDKTILLLSIWQSTKPHHTQSEKSNYGLPPSHKHATSRSVPSQSCFPPAL